MIPYLIGAGIGYIISELIHEEKAKEVVQTPAQNAPVENPPTSEPQTLENGEGDQQPEEKEVKFVAKSRGKKK